MSNIVFWATGPTAESPWEVDEGKFLNAAQRHLERLRQQLDLASASLGDATESRAALLHSIEGLVRRSPTDCFAKLIQNLAVGCGVAPYDIDDDQLQATAMRHLAGEAWAPSA